MGAVERRGWDSLDGLVTLALVATPGVVLLAVAMLWLSSVPLLVVAIIYLALAAGAWAAYSWW